MLDSQCHVQPGFRRGEIAFLGLIGGLGGGGHWAGVILDELVGKTDDTVQSSGIRSLIKRAAIVLVESDDEDATIDDIAADC